MTITGRPRRFLSLTLAIVMLGLGLVAVPTVTATLPQAQAVPGNPGVPGAPTEFFKETFQTATGNAPALSTLGYTADAYWRDPAHCVGIFVTVTSTRSAGFCDYATPANTNAPNEWFSLTAKARAIGLFNGTGDTNRVLAANTTGGASPTNVTIPADQQIMFRTQTPITIPAGAYRYISAQVTLAATSSTCRGNSSPLLSFSLLDGATEYPIQSAPIDVYAAPGTSQYTVAGQGTGSPATRCAIVGEFTSDQAQLFTGTTVGMILRNTNQGSTTGNDSALDDPTLIDTTPQLDKSFVPSTIPQGGTSLATFTITNRSDLGRKADWRFTDTLPSQVTYTGGAIGGTCATTSTVGAAYSATASGNTVTVTGGDLRTGDTSCTITVPVTSTTVGTWVNTPTNVTTRGLDLPAAASLTVTPVSNINVVKTFVSSTIDPATGVRVANYRVTVTNTGPSPGTYGPLTDTTSFGAGLTRTNATWTTSGTGAPAGGTVAGSGAINLAPAGTAIAVNATHTFNLAVTYTGSTTSLTCGAAGTALYNAASLPGSRRPAAPPTTPRVARRSISTRRSRSPRRRTRPRSAPPGRQVTYTINVSNPGNVTLTGVNVLDDYTAPAGPDIPTVTGCPTTLAPGASGTCTVTYTATQADVNAGSIRNTVTAIGNPPAAAGGQVSATANATVTAAPNASLTIVKSVTPTTVTGFDQTVVYSFVVRNTGNVTMSAIAINDTFTAPAGPVPAITCAATTLAPEPRPPARLPRTRSRSLTPTADGSTTRRPLPAQRRPVSGSPLRPPPPW